MTRVSLYCRGSAERTGTIYQVSVYRYCTHRQPQTIKIILNACTRHISLPRQKIKKVFFSYLPSVLESKYKIIKKKFVRSRRHSKHKTLFSRTPALLSSQSSRVWVCVCVCCCYSVHSYIKCRQHYKTWKRLLVHITGERDGIFFSGQERRSFNPFPLQLPGKVEFFNSPFLIYCAFRLNGVIERFMRIIQFDSRLSNDRILFFFFFVSF
jgi:hypothetical protein